MSTTITPVIPDLRDLHASMEHPVHVTMFAIELGTLADHHDVMASSMRTFGNHESADMMEARAAELRRYAVRARRP